jgi:hypothetical protein
MLDVQALGYELRAFVGHSPQQSFPAFVDERDVVEVDNAGPLVLTLACPRPGCSQLADPRSHQASLQDPFTICRPVHDGDPQHLYLSCLRSGIGPLLYSGVRSSDNGEGNADARTRRVSVTTELVDLPRDNQGGRGSTDQSASPLLLSI